VVFENEISKRNAGKAQDTFETQYIFIFSVVVAWAKHPRWVCY